jgi:hypothetical protein
MGITASARAQSNMAAQLAELIRGEAVPHNTVSRRQRLHPDLQEDLHKLGKKDRALVSLVKKCIDKVTEEFIETGAIPLDRENAVLKSAKGVPIYHKHIGGTHGKWSIIFTQVEDKLLFFCIAQHTGSASTSFDGAAKRAAELTMALTMELRTASSSHPEIVKRR